MIISVDPGVRFCGMAVLSKEEDNSIKVHRTLSVNNVRVPKDEVREFWKMYGKRRTQISKIVASYKTILEGFEDKIKGAAIENPYIHFSRPTGVIPIAEVTGVLGYVATEVYKIPMMGFSPKSIKATFAGVGDAEKDHMTAALKFRIEHNEIVLPEDIKIDDLTEHEIDAIGIGYTYLINYDKVMEQHEKETRKW